METLSVLVESIGYVFDIIYVLRYDIYVFIL